jgi:hypothetical protein
MADTITLMQNSFPWLIVVTLNPYKKTLVLQRTSSGQMSSRE